MSYYIGIDLGTTNSAICSFDGQNVRIWKSPEQNDITPSAIYVDKRGNRFYGTKACNQALYDPNNAAMLFKRFMGTNTKITLEASNQRLSPEECSAEILKVLFGYLPEEIRNDPSTATVITVPAAFNQMKKDATLQAAKLAGIGKVALMQEPVAAIMSIVRTSKQEGIFLVYDLGGGTFDVSIAEIINGKVTMLAHGGVEMCGGRDVDRMLFNKIVVPWLKQNFILPDDLLINKKYKTFCRVAQWATERAKIELSSMVSANIALSESEARTTDEVGNELYIDIRISRNDVDDLISDLVNETVEATRDVLSKAGLTSNDVERVVFIGGPTNYKPLRDRVAFELSLPVSIDVNPMTAVAEGASIFAESIDWLSESHNRKAVSKVMKTKLDLSFKYTARTSGDVAKVLCVLENSLEGYAIEFTCLDTGWRSGRASLVSNLIVDLPLEQNGVNRFSIKVFNEYGYEVPIGTSQIAITKTMATIGAITASHSVGVEVVEKLGGVTRLEFLVNEGDALPKKGFTTFKAGQKLVSGSNDSLNIKLWEGNIQSPITDNRFIGVLKISGTDFESGVIQVGADIECEYEMTDSGTINLKVSVPCIGATFSNRNHYSRQEGQLNLDDIENVAEQGREVLSRIQSIAKKVDDPRLEKARKKAELAANLDSKENCDPEDVQKASDELLNSKKLIYKTCQENLRVIRQLDLDSCVQRFNAGIRRFASPAEEQDFENMVRTAQRSIDHNDFNFENILHSIELLSTSILFKQDWFVINCYHHMTASSSNYVDKARFHELRRLGNQALADDDIERLRTILNDLLSIQIKSGIEEGMFDIANILKG